MKEKSIKSNIVWMIAVVFIGISSIVLIGCINNNIWRMIFGIMFFSSVWGFIFAIASLVGKKQFNTNLRILPYNFDYEAELIIYKNIGRTKKGKAVKNLKLDFQIPNVYTEWKGQLVGRYKDIINNENFYHYLKRSLRNAKNAFDILVFIFIPVEIAVMTAFITNDGLQENNFWVIIVSAVELSVLLIREFYKHRNEMDFVLDAIEVLCPQFGNDKGIDN